MKPEICRDKGPTRAGALLLTLVLLCALAACQSQRPADRLAPPWNAASSRYNVRHFTESGGDAVFAAPAEDAALSFEECVFTATQFAPDLVNSVIELELAEIGTADAFWKRFPKLNAWFRVVNNLTRHYDEYSDTTYRMGVGIHGFEPVVSFFESRSRELLEDIVYYTHQMAVEARARQIGGALLRLEYLERVHALQGSRLVLAKQAVTYYRTQQESATDRLELAKATRQVAQAEVAMEKTETFIAALMLNLKLMLGLDVDRALTVDAASLGRLLAADNASGIFADNAWEEVWAADPEAAIVRLSRKLRDYDVEIAWSQYLPTVSMDMYTTNPKSDYAAPSSDDEVFFALQFSIPLLDWGDRSRGVDKSVLRRVQEDQRGKLGRQRFAASWREDWQSLKLARADEQLAAEAVAISKLDEQKAAIRQQTGQGSFGDLLEARVALIESELALEEARLGVRSREMADWFKAGHFRRRFFEPYKTHLEEGRES